MPCRLPPNFIGTHFAVYAKLRPAAAEDRQLEDLKVAVDVGETDVTEPCALLLEGRQDVGILVRAVRVKPGHLFAALVRVMPVERVDKQLVVERHEPFGG